MKSLHWWFTSGSLLRLILKQSGGSEMTECCQNRSWVTAIRVHNFMEAVIFWNFGVISLLNHCSPENLVKQDWAGRLSADEAHFWNSYCLEKWSKQAVNQSIQSLVASIVAWPLEWKTVWGWSLIGVKQRGGRADQMRSARDRSMRS